MPSRRADCRDHGDDDRGEDRREDRGGPSSFPKIETLRELPAQLLDSPTIRDLESCYSFLRHRSQARQPSDWPAGPSSVKLVLRGAGQVTVFEPSPLGLRQVVPFVWLQNRTDPCIDAVHFIISSLCGPLEAGRTEEGQTK